MKRILLWLFSTVTVVVLLFGYRTSTSTNLGGSPPTPISSTIAPSTPGSNPSGARSSGSRSSGVSSGGSSPGPGSSASHGSPTKSTVTGSLIATEWGPVQVQLALQGKAITKVTVLQYPHGNSRDGEINSRALPILIAETTQAQSAQIDMVSGATVTSTGYVQSLQSALDKAGA